MYSYSYLWCKTQHLKQSYLYGTYTPEEAELIAPVAGKCVYTYKQTHVATKAMKICGAVTITKNIKSKTKSTIPFHTHTHTK